MNQTMKGICNICGLPKKIKVMEEDPDTGEQVEKEITIPCLGHEGLFTWCWNLSDAYFGRVEGFPHTRTYTDYQKLDAKQHANSGTGKE